MKNEKLNRITEILRGSELESILNSRFLLKLIIDDGELKAIITEVRNRTFDNVTTLTLSDFTENNFITKGYNDVFYENDYNTPLGSYVKFIMNLIKVLEIEESISRCELNEKISEFINKYVERMKTKDYKGYKIIRHDKYVQIIIKKDNLNIYITLEKSTTMVSIIDTNNLRLTKGFYENYNNDIDHKRYYDIRKIIIQNL